MGGENTYNWFSADYGYECGPIVHLDSSDLVPESLSMISSNRLCIKDEVKDELIPHRSTGLDSTKFSGPVVQLDNDDTDICILEDLSHPKHPKLEDISQPRHSEPAAPLATSNHSRDLYSTRETEDVKDERITYRVALQDLSQPSLEAMPPDGLLAVPLMKHQKIALSWMVYKETASLQCSGGFLADDQGLGKTISTIALILKERLTGVKQEDATEALNLDDEDDIVVKREDSSTLLTRRPGAGTLIVCPTSVLRQWAEELCNKVTKEANLSVLVYHGTNRKKDPLELEKYDVVITTYAIVGLEVPKQPLADKDDDERVPSPISAPMQPSSSKKRKDPPGKRDKGKKDKKGIAGPLARVGWFRVVLDEVQIIKNHRTQVARACWGLRAKRRWCLSGTPIQNSVDDLYSYFRFLRYDPYANYKSFRSMIKLPINRYPKLGYKKLQVVLKTIMLRRTKDTKIDGEPILTLPPKTVELKKLDFSGEERDFYFKLEADSKEQFNVYQKAGTVQQNYANILVLLLRLRQACDHPFLVKRYDSDTVWTSSLETAKKFSKQTLGYLLSCLEGSLEICGRCTDSPEEALVTMCGHVFCHQCISEHLINGDDNLCPTPECKYHLNATSVFSSATLKRSLFDDVSGPQNDEPLESYSEDFYSTKVRSALEFLESLSSKPTEKTIVFSQWTGMLDLVETRLKNSSIQYRRLDGKMSVIARERAVKDFNALPEVTVMIMSLKAASLGLNMVAACHVLLLDLWWNPTVEDQAIDRAHRIGQTRPVKVLRFTVKDTVEDRILALQQKKREMVAFAFGEDEKGNRQSRLTVEELRFLFMGSG